jgi:hypothetical protein
VRLQQPDHDLLVHDPAVIGQGLDQQRGLDRIDRPPHLGGLEDVDHREPYDQAPGVR